MTHRRSLRSAVLALAWTLGLATSVSATGIVAQTFGTASISQGSRLGSAVVAVGDKVVLGAPGASGPSCTNVGAVLVFDATSGAPLLEIPGDPIDGCLGELGFAVAEVQGDILAAAPLEAPGGDASSYGRVYRFDATTGAVQRTFVHPGPSFEPRSFGASLAVVGGEVLVGAPGTPVFGGEVPAGIVFRFDATTGDLLGTYAGPDPAPDDGFGSSLAVSQGRLFVGAWSFQGQPGAVHAFDLASGQHLWTAVGTGSTVSTYGRALAATDAVVAVGAPFGIGSTGSVHLLDAATGAELRTLGSPDPQDFGGAGFGISLATFGDGFLIGAYNAVVDGSSSRGQAYLFAATGELEYRFFPVQALEDFDLLFGSAVAPAGNRALIGAPGLDAIAFGTGGAFLFETCLSLGDGAACDDGNGCDVGDVCQGARCVAGAAVACPPPPQCRIPGCEPATGFCNERTVPTGSLCFLGGPTNCSVGDRCAGGNCLRNFDLPHPSLRDTDFDGVCVTDDICPTVANPGQENVDGDPLGDACDLNDGLLVLHSAVLRPNRDGRPGTGRVTLRGELLSRSTPPAGLAFNPDGGATVRLSDEAGFTLDQTWPASQCTGSGRLRCRSPGRPTRRVDFRPLQQRTDGLIVYTFSVKLDALDLEQTFVPPFRATLTSQPATPVIGVDRVGAIDGCREGRRRVACRVAVPLGSASEAFLELPETLVE